MLWILLCLKILFWWFVASLVPAAILCRIFKEAEKVPLAEEQKMKKGKEEYKYKEDEIMLVILRNLEAQIVPPGSSMGGLTADPIIVLKGTFLEIALNLREKN